jgi:large subunit ribosomal protein L30
MPRAASSKQKAARPKVVRITLVKSPIGYSVRHKATIRALGLHRMNQAVEQVDTPTLRGMLAKVNHLVEIEEVTEA